MRDGLRVDGCTEVPGITIDPDGRRIMDKERNTEAPASVFEAITQEQAKQCLRAEIIIEIPSLGLDAYSFTFG
jgi:hypothetical protein